MSPKRKQKGQKRPLSAPTNKELAAYSETELLHKSNLFRLQTVELIREVVPKQLNSLEAAVRALRTEVMALPPAVLAWECSEEAHGSLPRVSHPELQHLRLSNRKMSLSWQPPEHVQLVGSYLLRTVARPALNVDVAIQIPQACLLHKDYLDHRYVDKRMLYLAHLGAQLLRAAEAGGDVTAREVGLVWLPHLQDRSWPVLQLTMPGIGGGWTIRLVPTLAHDAFSPAKLLPDRANLRDRLSAHEDGGVSGDADGGKAASSPEYNNRLALESVYVLALRLLHAKYAADADGNLREATIMLKAWQRQRSSRASGGVSGFQLSLLLVHLLSTRVLSHSMSPYNIFRVVLAFLSKNALESRAIVLPPPPDAEATEETDGSVSPQQSLAAATKFGRFFPWVLTDSTLHVNFGAGVTRGALCELRLAAARSIVAMDSAAMDEAVSFAELFTRAQPPFVKYDALFSFELPDAEGARAADVRAQNERVARIAAAAAKMARGAAGVTSDATRSDAAAASNPDYSIVTPLSEDVVLGSAAAVESVLSAGLARRARLVRCWREPLARQPLLPSSAPTPDGASTVHVGVILEPALVAGLVDRGPVPGSEGAAAWSDLWGQKSETRRFKDGAVVHAVVWEADEASRHLIPAQAVRHLLSRHLDVDGTATSLGALDRALRHESGGGSVSGRPLPVDGAAPKPTLAACPAPRSPLRPTLAASPRC